MDLVIQSITSKYADFSTRASKKEFWLFALLYLLAYFFFIAIDFSIDTFNYAIGFGLFSGIFWLATIVPYLAVSVRRLHDTNRVGWWYFLILIPLVGSIWLIVLLCLKSDEGENRFG